MVGDRRCGSVCFQPVRGGGVRRTLGSAVILALPLSLHATPVHAAPDEAVIATSRDPSADGTEVYA